MPSVDANRHLWGVAWESSGDEWSEPWGGPAAQWHGVVLPRIRRFLPAGQIVEIAPGRGRWTSFLLDHCDRLVGIDLNDQCITACEERFADEPRASFVENDGASLPGVDDASTDLVFSYDSLVHVEADTLRSYLGEIARVLRPDGAAFLHHSNYAATADSPASVVDRTRELVGRSLPGLKSKLAPLLHESRWHSTLEASGVIETSHWRAESVSAEIVASLARDAGLRCVGQEVVNWRGRSLIDCMSLIVRAGSKWDRPNVVRMNPDFMAEASSIKRASEAFGA